MVFDDWNTIVNILSKHHSSGIFYVVSFTFLLTFGFLNLFIGIFVNALGTAFEEASEHHYQALLLKMQKLTDQINTLTDLQQERK
jgi:hypothetical protein